MSEDDNADLSKKIFVECECGEFNHVMEFAMWDWNDYTDPAASEPPEFYALMRIDHHEPWYQRVWSAVRYIFAANDLHYHDVLITRKSAERLQSLCKDYLLAYELYDLGKTQDGK
jgi:hypothetical protein